MHEIRTEFVHSPHARIRLQFLFDGGADDLGNTPLGGVVEAIQYQAAGIKRPSLPPDGFSVAFSLTPRLIRSSFRKKTRTGLLADFA